MPAASAADASVSRPPLCRARSNPAELTAAVVIPVPVRVVAAPSIIAFPWFCAPVVRMAPPFTVTVPPPEVVKAASAVPAPTVPPRVTGCVVSRVSANAPLTVPVTLMVPISADTVVVFWRTTLPISVIGELTFVVSAPFVWMVAAVTDWAPVVVTVEPNRMVPTPASTEKDASGVMPTAAVKSTVPEPAVIVAPAVVARAGTANPLVSV